jgi:hypothetical protein
MATSTLRVVCECGKDFTVIDGPLTRSSIRCHMCGRMVDVPSRKKAIAKAQAEAEKIEAKRQGDRRIALAEESNYAGLQLDGIYKTCSPIILDSDYGETLSLSLDFRRDLTVDYECRLDEDSEVEEESGTTNYELPGGPRIRFSFDVGWWETEWEGVLCDEQMRLTCRMEVHSPGPATFLKCVVEGEATLLLVRSDSDMREDR